MMSKTGVVEITFGVKKDGGRRGSPDVEHENLTYKARDSILKGNISFDLECADVWVRTMKGTYPVLVVSFNLSSVGDKNRVEQKGLLFREAKQIVSTVSPERDPYIDVELS